MGTRQCLRARFLYKNAKEDAVSKRVLMLGLLGLSLVALLGTEAQAHYLGYINGVHVASIVCTLGLKGVANPDTNPAIVDCQLTDVFVEALCRNPSGHDVPGKPGFHQVGPIGEEPIEEGDITGKGKALVDVHIDDDPVCNSRVVCGKPNWQVKACLLRSFTATQNAYRCVGPATDPCSVLEQASFVKSNCVLPAVYTVNAPPPLEPPISAT
jgi:hypothetical protein